MIKTIIYECCVPPCMQLYRKLSSLSFDSFHNKFSQRLSVCPIHGTTMRMTSLILAIAVVSTSVLPYCHYRFHHFAGVTNITSDCTTIMTRDFSYGLPCQTNDTSNPILTLSPSLNCVDFNSETLSNNSLTICVWTWPLQLYNVHIHLHNWWSELQQNNS